MLNAIYEKIQSMFNFLLGLKKQLDRIEALEIENGKKLDLLLAAHSSVQADTLSFTTGPIIEQQGV